MLKQQTMRSLIEELFPICRSITGDGVRETLRVIGDRIDLEVHEVPTGTEVFDWTVPREWNIRDGWIQAPDGRRVVDFSVSNLHVTGYSVPVRKRLSLDELRSHLHTLPEQPDAIPYRTSYYQEQWSFCLAHRVLESLEPGEYEVCIESSLADGYLTYGELLIPGEVESEFLIHTHVCHPSMCNDNLSGIAVATALAEWLGRQPNRLSYRFVFAPGTIGAITWIALNQDRLHRVRGGLVLSGLGDSGELTYKRTRRGDASIDRAAEHVLRHRPGSQVSDFSPYGYDERQYGSPGINLAVGRLSRTPWGQYPEYHTSGDNLDFVSDSALAGSLDACKSIVDVLENDAIYRNLKPECEPQLGRRGLYGSLGGLSGPASGMALLWVLNLSDGEHGLLDIAERSGVPFAAIHEAAMALASTDLLEVA